MKQKVRIAFDSEVHELVLPSTLTELKNNIAALYKNLPIEYKIRYNDEDGDLISIINQNDYEFALGLVKENALFTIYPTEEKLQINDAPLSDDFPLNPSNPKAQSIYNCMRCKGTALTRKGKACKRCDGTGRMSEELVERVKKIVKREVEKIMRTEVPLHASKLAQSQRLTEDLKTINVVHYETECKNCGLKPIVGTRYSCTVCKELNLCEICEKSFVHKHAMCKIRRPKQEVPEKFCNMELYTDKLYDIAIVHENLVNSEKVVEAGSNCIKTWTLKNTGKLEWPRETILTINNLFEPMHAIKEVGNLKPGWSTKITFEFRVPVNKGNYSSFCQVYAGKGLKLGNPLNLEIEVKEPVPILANEIKKEIRAKLGKVHHTYIDNLVKLKQRFGQIDYEFLIGILKETRNDLETAIRVLKNN
eukprot:TRINITY_DN7126_c0_g2_i1.p1 TRINITY_DN7126_c0_g2~~TRINITY_DN7126_c0_g2_i1.p1  ORF type:complete len:419 (+),score=91.78 TRINITY_DN7126_c0_g2_i1:136-1392(+)